MIKHVDLLLNPDVTDISVLYENPASVRNHQVDQVAEVDCSEHMYQAQEWAGIKQASNADLFVFVCRRSGKQKDTSPTSEVMPWL